MKIKTMAIVAALMALAILIGFTVANKGWWIRRVNRKWQIATLPNATGDSPFTVRGQDLTKLTLLELAQVYREGAPGWELKKDMEASGEPAYFTNANGSVDYTRYANGQPVPLG